MYRVWPTILFRLHTGSYKVRFLNCQNCLASLLAAVKNLLWKVCLKLLYGSDDIASRLESRTSKSLSQPLGALVFCDN